MLSVTQGTKRLAKDTEPKYAFTMADIDQIFGGLENLFKSLEGQGFSNGTNVLLRRLYGSGARSSYITIETLSLNFPEKTMTENIPVTAPQMPQAAYAPALGMPAMGYAQIPNEEWVNNKVIKERFNDLKKKMKN